MLFNMGYIERKYIVTEYSYFENTEENLQAIRDKEFGEVVIDDYSSENDWYSLPGLVVYDDDNELINSDDEGFSVVDNEGNKIYDTEWN